MLVNRNCSVWSQILYFVKFSRSEECCLFFFDLWILITPLVSSNSSCLTPSQQFFCYIIVRTIYIEWFYDDIRFVLEQKLNWIFIVKKRSADRHVATLEHIILISSKSVYIPYLMLRAKWRSSKYQIHYAWFDHTEIWSHDLSHSGWAHLPIHHRYTGSS
jgi:hypothetical protein